MANVVLAHKDGDVEVAELNGRRAISVNMKDGRFTPATRWTTSYPLDLIEHVLQVKGPAYLCSEIMRDEDPVSVQHSLRWDILSYLPPEDFAGKRVLDFGSGSGASSMVLARMLPAAEIVGVELEARLLDLAEHRARYYGISDRVTFQLSPDPNSLPSGIGEFDFIILSAVFEHLLPGERTVVLPLLWQHLKPGGILFVDQTPYRWFPVERHTTGLPLLNYLPDRLAHQAARRFSRRVNRSAPWPQLLRNGIRGGTEGEVLAILRRSGGDPVLLEPQRLGTRDRIDLWYRLSTANGQTTGKRLTMWGFRALRAATGITMTPNLALAIKKAAQTD